MRRKEAMGALEQARSTFAVREASYEEQAEMHAIDAGWSEGDAMLTAQLRAQADEMRFAKEFIEALIMRLGK